MRTNIYWGHALVICALLLGTGAVNASIRPAVSGCVAVLPSQAGDIVLGIYANIRNVSTSDRDVYCPIQAEGSVGSVANFHVTVDDRSANKEVTCTAIVLDSSGQGIAIASIGGSGVSQTGFRSFSSEIDVGSTSNVSYFLQCTIPGGSSIEGIYVD